MRFFARAVLAAALIFVAGSAANASIVITVDKTAQQLTVEVNGAMRYQWPVSTARWGYRTPNGSYRPQRLERQWYSRKYDWSPMPHSIFFNGGYAIHGSYEISRLGRPASHGCIRLHPQNAATLFELVKGNVNNTQIVVTGGGEELMAIKRTPAKAASDVFVEQRPRRASQYSQSFEEIFDDTPRHAGSNGERRLKRRIEWR